MYGTVSRVHFNVAGVSCEVCPQDDQQDCQLVLATHTTSMAMFLIFCQKEPGTKASKGAKGKKDEKQEAAKEGTTPSENGENKAEEAQKTESVGDKNE
ncbi:hypothetical protein DV515_00000838 [Chloebia gouldiae]|uniref:High mobility group nucleosome-binding domain-containing protein 3 n=60 Tax=Aves TaxID=8782 RepID=A0A3L8SZ42_CHLGU|nr:hypothetical protein DV515_00000838 [Chloebia gouldiae]